MSRLDDLVHKLCPNGVHYYTIDELIKNKIIALISPIYKIKQKEYLEIGSTPIISQEAEYVSGYTNLKDPRLPNDEYVCFGDHTEHLKYVDFEFVQGADGLKVMHIENKEVLNTKYYYYVCSSYYLKKNTYERHFKHLRECLLPLPPLEVQKEIVRLLDDFTAKTAELQAELNKEYEARKKQYEYYKEVLLCNNENVDKVKIKDIVCKTNKIKWNQTENTYQYIDLSSVDRETHTLLNTSIIDRNNAPSRAQQIVCVDDVLFGTTRPMLKRLCVIPDEYDGQICSTGFCVLRAIDNIVQPKWIYHVLNTTQFYSYVESHQQGTSYPSISDSLVKEYEITLPSLDEQIRIINILDNLEETNFELNNNLSLELESRQKQYEFYRDKLLTFKELS